jgi:hypothetical protein
MICPNCGSKTPKEKKVPKEKELIVIDGYTVTTTRPIFQCKNPSCKCAFNPLEIEIE